MDGTHTVDLGEVTVLSAAGLHAFEDAVALVRERDARLRLVNMSPVVYRAVTTFRLDARQGVELAASSSDLPVHGQLGIIARDLNRLTGALLERPTVTEVLEHIVGAALGFVPGADLASVTLRAGDTFRTPIRTDELAEELDRLQYTYGGPTCAGLSRPGTSSDRPRGFSCNAAVSTPRRRSPCCVSCPSG